MVMNFATNVLGLGNAATPFGLKAMRELRDAESPPRRGERRDGALPRDQRDGHHAVSADRHDGDPRRRGLARARGDLGADADRHDLLDADGGDRLLSAARLAALRRAAARAARPQRRRAVVAVAAASDELERSLAAEPAQPAGPARRAFIGAVALGLLVALVLDVRRRLETQPAGDVATQVLQSWLFPTLIVGLLLVGRGRPRARLRGDDRGSEGRTRSRGSHRPVSDRDSRRGRDVSRLRRARPADRAAGTRHEPRRAPGRGAADGASCARSRAPAPSP